MRHLLLGLVTVTLAAPWAAAAEDDAWDRLDALRQEKEGVEAHLRQTEAALAILREAVPSDADPDLAAARQALAEAEKAEAAAHAAAGLQSVGDRLRTAQAARDARATELLTASPEGRRAVEALAAMQQRIEVLSGRAASLTAAELGELARLTLEERALGRRLYGIHRALWERAEVLPLYRKADDAYKAYGSARGKDEAFKEAQTRVKRARRALDEVRAKLPLKGEVAEEALARRARLVARRDALDVRIDALRKQLLDGASETHMTVERPPRSGKPQKPARLTLWIPPGCAYVRGVVVAHPQVGKFASHPLIREAAARADLATMVMPTFSFDGAETMRHLDGLLDQLAAKSGHPELKGAAVLTAGLSASVLAARNVGYAAPDRVFGIVHIAGGNMHHNIVDPTRTLSGVPFIAMNGEFEWCGPEGGIRPAYGRQTQWVMIREQLLRRWRSDHQHLVSLVVVPGGDHGDWDAALAALFVRKAAAYRLPKETRDGSTPARCVSVKAEDGWLTDADLDHPTHDPAPFDRYAGDKGNVFWHFDEEMARAVYDYHAGKFLLPDPTKQSPVPGDWPPKKK